MGSGFKSLCRLETIRGLSLLLVLSPAPRGFSLATAVFPSPQKPTLPNSNSILNARTRLNEFIRTPKCFVGKEITITITITNSLKVARLDFFRAVPPKFEP